MVKTFEVLSWHEWTDLEEIHVSTVEVEGVSPSSSEVSLEPAGKRDTVLICAGPSLLRQQGSTGLDGFCSHREGSSASGTGRLEQEILGQ